MLQANRGSGPIIFSVYTAISIREPPSGGNGRLRFNGKTLDWTLLFSGHGGLNPIYKVIPPSSCRPNPMLQANRGSGPIICSVYTAISIREPPSGGNGRLRSNGKTLDWTHGCTAGIHSLDLILADGDMKPFGHLQEEFGLHPQQA
ncbi:hypothetical protein NDU88_002342 [Pleurodeles waltl]|uniref:Uncharacterized protein n=1 Tax=Pleurodeles waltl TaxID=8319 RepID=A0AAV7M3U9_PLEWA|nr:hypothetical protein NDU88_002342 [Pleurodeles waltl]